MQVPLKYIHADVFSPVAYSGNSLVVFPDAVGLAGPQMALITKELRHFEAIFLEASGDPRTYRARVFDLIEELAFAGHPVIGAACVLHALAGAAETERWTIELRARTVTIETQRRDLRRFFATLKQGHAEFLGTWHDRRAEIASWFSLTPADLNDELPPETVSTGLRYLVLPVRAEALARARISVPDLEAKLSNLGAQFAYLIDIASIEGRHWNNDGLVEDVATGSGAGCVAAYLRRHDRIGDGRTTILRQGRFVGRASQIAMKAHGSGSDVHSVEIGGDVSLVGAGQLDVMPDIR
jgi:trans-2,3-dihydro-3-hydroxyanthranilate isomerase